MIPIYEQTLFTGKPDLTAYGLKAGIIMYEGSFLTEGAIDETKTRNAAQTLLGYGDAIPNDYPIVIDIEAFDWNINNVTEAEANTAIDNLIQVLAWFRDEAPKFTQIGYYSIGPNREYWPAQDRYSSTYQTWQNSNTFLERLIAHCDALFPSLYTFYGDKPGWVQYARENIAEAKRISNGKPVYPYLWMQYHGSDVSFPQTMYLDYEYWTLQLQTASDLCEGIVIWGGWIDGVGAEVWDGDKPWWVATQDFINAAPTRWINKVSIGLRRPTFQSQG